MDGPPPVESLLISSPAGGSLTTDPIAFFSLSQRRRVFFPFPRSRRPLIFFFFLFSIQEQKVVRLFPLQFFFNMELPPLNFFTGIEISWFLLLVALVLFYSRSSFSYYSRHSYELALIDFLFVKRPVAFSPLCEVSMELLYVPMFIEYRQPFLRIERFDFPRASRPFP